ncbi:MAG: tRNA uridine-5-carboxymethylaminomethyl(34) synthesis GTPase MnmE, partial [Oscillospiraceae bacterium]
MKTIVALSTANASSAIAMLRLSGTDAVELASTVFVPFSGKKIDTLAGYTAAYGQFKNEDEIIDDGVTIVYKAPKSYTGENMAELCCHGNRIIVDKIMAALIKNGAVPASAGEFTKRAFFNGKMDLSQAEAVAELISAEGEAAYRGALMRKSGKLGQQVDSICDKLLMILSDMGVWADYPEETDTPFVTYEGLARDLGGALQEIRSLCDGYKTGRLMERGIKVAVVGAPNVGKSTLSNVLWERERSIVTSIAGTTRDVIEGDITIKGIKITLLDTAGIREAPDEIEKIGVDRSYKAINDADLVLLITDAARGITMEDRSLLTMAERLPHIVV